MLKEEKEDLKNIKKIHKMLKSVRESLFKDNFK